MSFHEKVLDQLWCICKILANISPVVAFKWGYWSFITAHHICDMKFENICAQILEYNIYLWRLSHRYVRQWNLIQECYIFKNFTKKKHIQCLSSSTSCILWWTRFKWNSSCWCTKFGIFSPVCKSCTNYHESQLVWAHKPQKLNLKSDTEVETTNICHCKISSVCKE